MFSSKTIEGDNTNVATSLNQFLTIVKIDKT